jgi:tyrosyl-tRNA synthetase
VPILDLLAVETSIFSSKGEARKMIAANGFSINKCKYTDVDGVIDMSAALHHRYVILQKGKKNYYVIELI